MTRKAQAEILGLVIIVFLLLVVGLVVAMFIKTPDTTRDIYVTKALSQKFVNVLIKSDSGCSDLSFAELLEDCAFNEEYYRQVCYYDSEDIDSCNYSQQMISEILDNSFKQWGYSYRFELTNVGDFSPISYGFPTGNQQLGFYPLRSARINFYVYS